MKYKKMLFFITLVLAASVTACQGGTPDTKETVAEAPPAPAEEPEPTEEELTAMRREETVVPLLAEAEKLAKGYFYEEALECLSKVPEEFAQDEEVTAAVLAYTEGLASFVPYDQPVRHIFFHSLIVDTSLAFDGDHMSNGYNYWMTTTKEFQAILEQLYANNYILINIHDLCTEQTAEDGTITLAAAQPLVPEGKIPLVLSVDDVSYYDYMKEDGFPKRLVLDENGEVKNLYIDPDGTEHIGDYDVMPILDTFVREHPDFSFRGAKGIIAATGYEGTLGYRVNDPESPTLEEDQAAVRAVAARLKETGWLFASHGYGHRHTADISYHSLVEDTTRWKTEIASLLGDTDLYIYPYGEEIDYPSQKLTYLQSEGFRFFCGVWASKPFVSVQDTYVRQTRCNLDGFTMIKRPESVSDLIDAAKVVDPDRPELE